MFVCLFVCCIDSVAVSVNLRMINADNPYRSGDIGLVTFNVSN
jgi:hypothetical protein